MSLLLRKNQLIAVLNHLINESNNISPLRFKESDPSDIIDFVEQLLYNSKNIDITEKIAGQHLTVTIKNNFVTVNNKDSLLHGTGDKNAKHTKYGSELTKTLMKYLQVNPLPDQTWAFEIINPQFNHDFIKYKNIDVVFIEYTGNLTDTVANDLRQHLQIRLLTKNDIKININKNKYFDTFKNEWETSLKAKYTNLDPRNKSRFYYKAINELKYKIGELLENILVSVIDKVSPIEGVVIGTKTPIKLQTNAFLQVQRVQMSMYSLFKISKSEIDTVLANPLMPLSKVKAQYNLEMKSIYKGDLNYSLYDITKKYLIDNTKLDTIDTNKYNKWLSTAESNSYLARLNHSTIVTIYKELYSKIK